MIKKSTIKTPTRILTVFLIAILLFCTLFSQGAYGFTSTELKKTSRVDSISSGSSNGNDYVKVSTNDKKINVQFKHSQGYDRIVLRLVKKNQENKEETVKGADAYFKENVTANKTFNGSLDCSSIPDGNYYFRIVVQKDDRPSELTNYPTYMQGIFVAITSGVPALHRFDNIVQSNVDQSAIGDYRLYNNKSLSELKFQLFANIVTEGSKKTYRDIQPTTEAGFYKKTADKILQDAGVSNSNNYTKMKTLFTYVAQNFYYDHDATSSGRTPYDDPYYNLSYVVKKTGNGYNANSGKVALHCDGFAGVFIALARSQGIPCRMIYGRKVTPAASSWDTCPDSYFSTNSHTWVQAWTDNRWVNIDPQQGSMSSYGEDKAWKKSPIVNYTYFDISNDLFAYTHYARDVLGGDKTAAYLSTSNEVAQLSTFLSYNGNGKKLNNAFTASDKSTWGNSTMLQTDGFGSLAYLLISDKKLTGYLNLGEFDKLTTVSAWKNQLTRFNAVGCISLEKVYISGNQLPSIDLSSSKQLAYCDTKGNPLTSAQFYIKSDLKTIGSNGNGTFGFMYDKSQTKALGIYPKADIGYKFTGLYDASTGAKLSISSAGYLFNPTASKYTLSFGLNPNSFKYTIRRGANVSLKPYTLAVQKRLKELGYLRVTPNGVFGPSTEAAVKTFQKNNGVSQTGAIGSSTWAKLFSSTAKTASSAPAFKYLLKRGNSSAYKSYNLTAQKRLKELGYLTATPNGIFGPSTEAAVKAFQKNNGMGQYGYIGKGTWEKLFSSTAKKAPTSSAPAFKYLLKRGNSSAYKSYNLTAQKRLKELGYLTATPNGIFGPSTEAAVKAFQKNNGMGQYGYIGKGTWEKLFSSTAKRA